MDALMIPGNSLTRPPVAEVISIGVYLASCASIIALGEAMRTTRRRLETGERQLSSVNLALETKVEAQSLIAAIVASSEDAIISTTLDERITSWNKGGERLFGYTALEAISQSIMMLVPPDQHEQELSLLARMQQSPRAERLGVRITKAGQRRDISLTVSPVHDRHGHIIGASTTARDVTARKAAEARLQHSEEAHRLLSGIHDATRGLHDPAAVMQEIVTRVGLHFEVTRCAYGEVNTESEVIEITRGYTNGVPTVAGRYPLQVFGPLMVGELKAGRTVVIADVRRDPLTDDAAAHTTYEHMQIVSMICVPVLRSQRLVAVMVVSDGKPRTWELADAEIVEQVAERTLFRGGRRARRGEAAREPRRAGAGDAGRQNGRLVARPGTRYRVVEPGTGGDLRAGPRRPGLQPRATVRRDRGRGPGAAVRRDQGRAGEANGLCHRVQVQARHHRGITVDGGAR